jgi:hypothetical protein
MALSKFSYVNTPSFNVAPDFGDHPMFHSAFDQYNPPTYVRQTNEWVHYFGDFPRFCAKITQEECIQGRIDIGYRHVVRVPVNTTTSPQMVHLPQRDIMDKVARIIQQLEKLKLTWRKDASQFVIELDENVNMELFVCDDSGMFHVLMCRDIVSGPDGRLIRPGANTVMINQLIFCIRAIFLDWEPEEELPILTETLWDAVARMTIEPDFDQVDFEPVLEDSYPPFTPPWMNDTNADWHIEPDHFEGETTLLAVMHIEKH